MLSALSNDLDLELVIGITFTAVFAVLLLVETPRPRKRTSEQTKLESTEAQTTVLEEAEVQRMINQVKLALKAAEKAEKEQTGRVNRIR